MQHNVNPSMPLAPVVVGILLADHYTGPLEGMQATSLQVPNAAIWTMGADTPH